MKNILLISSNFLSSESLPGYFSNPQRIDYLFYLYEHVHLRSLIKQDCQNYYYFVNTAEQFVPRVKELLNKYFSSASIRKRIFISPTIHLDQIINLFLQYCLKNEISFDHLAYFQFDGDDGLPVTWISNIFKYLKANEFKREIYYLIPKFCNIFDFSYGKYAIDIDNRRRAYGVIQVYPQKVIISIKTHAKVLNDRNAMILNKQQIIFMPESICGIYYSVQNLNWSNCMLFHYIFHKKYGIILKIKDMKDDYPDFYKIYKESNKIFNHNERYINSLEIKTKKRMSKEDLLFFEKYKENGENTNNVNPK